MEFGITSYMLTSFCTVFASILENLGVDFVHLGVQRGSNLAPRALQSRPRATKSRPRQAKSSPRADQDAQEQPKTRQGLAQEPPETAQEPAKSRPRCPGTAQDLPRTCSGSAQDLPEPLETPRITCDLKRTPSFITQSFRTSFQATKRPKSKTSDGGTPPKGVFNNRIYI